MSETSLGANFDKQSTAYMAELSLVTQLRSVATEAEGDTRILFSSDIVEPLLRDETHLTTNNVNNILSALEENATKIIRSLDVTSLQCLAYLLLNSGIHAGQERGLYLLLDGPQLCVKDESAALSPADYSRLTQQRLLNTLYQIFIDRDQDHGLRRLTGNLLAELMLESGEGVALLLEAQAQDFAGIVSIASFEADVVSKFFASVIIRIIHLAGISTEFLWTPDDLYRRAFFHTTDIPSDDIVKSYYLYARETEQEAFRDEGVRVGNVKETDGQAQSCYILRSILIDGNVLAEGSILTSLISSTLLFIYVADSTYRKRFNYIEISLKSSPRLMRSSVSQREGQESLCLHLEPAISISKNGRRQTMKERTLILQSNEDLAELRKALIGICAEPKMGISTRESKPRRSSSTVVSLDTAEVVVRKSKRLSEARARKETYTAKHTLPRSMSPASGVKLPSATRVSNAVSFDGPLRRDVEHEVIGGGGGWVSNVTDKKNMKGLQLSSPCQNEEYNSNQMHDDLTVSKTLSDQDAGIHTTSRAKRPTERQQISSNEPAATASQNRKLMSRHKPCTLSFNNRDKPRLSNTQESLIFHPQRAYRKVYATHRKEPIDWDEDLRPSGESELGKGNESTPVFSPASGERSAFDKRPSSGQKVIREASSSAGKRQRPPARSTGSAIKGTNSISGPISYDMKLNNATEVPRYKGGLKTFEGIDIRTEDHSSSSDSENLVSGKCVTDDSTSIESSAKGVTSLLEIEEHRQRASEPTPALHSGDNNADDTHSYLTDAKDSGPSQAHTKPQLLGTKHLGRGQGIGGKLAAAFQLEEISSQWNRSHSHRHDASPDRKSQSNPETAMSSIQSMEEPPRNKLVVESNLARTCENNDGDCVISRSSDTDRSLNRFMDQKRPNEVQETNQNKCQGIVREVEMISASIETVATELLDDGKWETRSKSATNLTQSRRHAQPRHGDTLISQSDHSSRSCIGNDEPGPGAESSGITRAATSKHSGPVSAKPLLRHDSQQVQDHTAEHQRMTPRKSIVDINGSPRLLSHMENKIIISDGTVHRESQSRQLTQDEKQVPARSIDDESGYDGGIEESFVEVPGTKSNLAHTAYGESSGMRIKSPFAQGHSLPRNREDRTRGMHRDRFRAASVPHRQHIRIDIAGQDLYQSPSQGELASIDSNWNTTVISSSRGRSLKQTKGDTTLQALQRSTQEMLLDSSERLTRGLETEKQTVNDVLETYRRQCHRVLDQLFKAQEERINLCKQQMDIIRNHHANVCQEIIHRLEATERCARKRTNSHLSPEGSKGKKHKSA